jgi:hypothetical protein
MTRDTVRGICVDADMLRDFDAALGVHETYDDDTVRDYFAARMLALCTRTTPPTPDTKDPTPHHG